MNIELLKSQADFDKWIGENIYYGDTADQPSEFPVYARTVVQSWNKEEERAEYLYRKDIEIMLAAMTPNV